MCCFGYTVATIFLCVLLFGVVEGSAPQGMTMIYLTVLEEQFGLHKEQLIFHLTGLELQWLTKVALFIRNGEESVVGEIKT